MTPGSGIEPWPHWWEASALINAPTLLPLRQPSTCLSDEPLGSYADLTSFMLTRRYKVWISLRHKQKRKHYDSEDAQNTAKQTHAN